MNTLNGKKILLGVTGSIAAYKAAFLVRLLIKAGAEVKVLMTPAATDFITPLTLSTLSKNPVFTSVSSEESWNNHVELGLWADVMLIAPATATTLSKLANGLCDNMLVACYLSAKCPVFFAPAMDLDMWKHPATIRNIQRLQAYGNHLIPVGHGELASGLVGAGRMAAPEDILDFIGAAFAETLDLTGKTVLITAGPTYEAIDPVRFIGNRSSGKMGVAIATELLRRGATVKLILGPSTLQPSTEIEVFRVESAQEMYECALAEFPTSDVAILAAAVADYRPTVVADQKIKKKGDNLQLTLEKTKDIAFALGQQKRADQFMIGFALETNNELENAKGKLARKNFDFIVLNSLNDKGAGFQHDTNKITIFHQDNKIQKFELKSKQAVAVDIVETLIERLSTL
ncbi:MAG: bifunctional phosphopantothenoylcysteine decarboxylase/phosphopantothenate--cysteine ligase CoaBC [Saprospiraceae bacterium]